MLWNVLEEVAGLNKFGPFLAAMSSSSSDKVTMLLFFCPFWLSVTILHKMYSKAYHCNTYAYILVYYGYPLCQNHQDSSQEPPASSLTPWMTLWRPQDIDHFPER